MVIHICNHPSKGKKVIDNEDYETHISEILAANGAFYAIGDEEVQRLGVKGVEYAQASFGVMAPKAKAKIVADLLKEARETAVIDRLEKYTKEELIQYELYVHESHNG